MKKKTEDIYLTSIHDRYATRPSSLEDMCLAKFDLNYESSFQKHAEDQDEGSESETDNECETPQNKQAITLRNGMGKMRKRRREAVLRVIV